MRQSPVPPASPLVGMQIGSHTMLDEGIERCLDLIQETAAVDTIFPYSHAYGGNLRKPADILARDHGIPPRDQRERNLPLVWVRTHEEYYRDTALRHQLVDASHEYHGRDPFAEMIRPLRDRGMKVYARILEAGSSPEPDLHGNAGARGIRNFGRVVTVDVQGRPTRTACWNHPEYRAFWAATAEDLFRSYELDGFQWGAERDSPLTNVLHSGDDADATCFCPFCVERGRRAGVDPERARQGFVEMARWVRGLREGGPAPDGAYAGYLRILFRYPEVLAWEREYRAGREEAMRVMYDTVKGIAPDAPVGWHVDHWASSMAMIPRAVMSYEEMAPYSDYLKVVMYHAVAASRMAAWVLNAQRGIGRDLTPEAALELHYTLFGYDPEREPTLAEATADPPAGGSPDYVRRETRRSVASAGGRTRIYPGLGFNVAGGTTLTPASAPDDPDTIAEVVRSSLEAGADGVVASREYEEMTVPNLRGWGRAVRAWRDGRG